MKIQNGKRGECAQQWRPSVMRCLYILLILIPTAGTRALNMLLGPCYPTFGFWVQTEKLAFRFCRPATA
ncbi:hypothetical protein KL86CLO1_13029 [uncultured Eubacteriales bacterium]|uniref:Uncharacterized protein n=1 Tax=uncultured Eubacteriales bacterium TaxID=172733 RepID=A0A212KG76_9FIRM|nr:hypothetical protein KL86CLO1_13029 [uncultured Eubacteriales bacterium]